RILMMHRFDALAPEHVVVRSTELAYDETPAVTHLTSVTQAGWKREGETYARVPLPPIRFGYSPDRLLPSSRPLHSTHVTALPAGVDGHDYLFLDYYGEAIQGIFAEYPYGGWYYKRPEGRDEGTGLGGFGSVECIEDRPG